jgi:transglutaminase-like putative cysteine protease
MALLTREMLPPAEPEKPVTTLRFIPDGNAGIGATLDAMVNLTRQFRTELAIRRLGEQIVAAVPGKSWHGEADAVQNWVRNNIRYTMDVADVETLKTPLALLYDRFGDCDDMALLAGTLLNSIGHPVRYVATSSNGVDYDHVYTETKIGARWVGVETTEDVALGWKPQSTMLPMMRHV